MSVAAIRRSFQVVHHLMSQGETRFTDLAHILAPISRTGLSHLLASLKEIGELEHDGRKYRLTPTAASLAGQAGAIYSLPPSLTAQIHPIVERTAAALGHSCALFALVGKSTMKVLDSHNLPVPHQAFPATDDELPLMPFHGFAQLFLSHAPESVALECYRYWLPYLQPNPGVRLAPTEEAFLAELRKIRRLGHALEYRAEVRPVLRVAVPVPVPDLPEVRFAVGIVANFVYLLEVEAQIGALRAAAVEMAEVMDGKLPTDLFPSGRSPATTTPLPAKSVAPARSGARARAKSPWQPEEPSLTQPERDLIAS